MTTACNENGERNSQFQQEEKKKKKKDSLKDDC